VSVAGNGIWRRRLRIVAKPEQKNDDAGAEKEKKGGQRKPKSSQPEERPLQPLADESEKNKHGGQHIGGSQL
jgi:hypothetical protein